MIDQDKNNKKFIGTKIKIKRKQKGYNQKVERRIKKNYC